MNVSESHYQALLTSSFTNVEFLFRVCLFLLRKVQAVETVSVRACERARVRQRERRRVSVVSPKELRIVIVYF